MLQDGEVDDLKEFRNFWGYSLIFTCIDLLIMFLPIVQLEDYSLQRQESINYYLISEILSVVSLIDQFLTRKYEGHQAFMSRLNVFKIGLSMLIILFCNIL